jgi:hypothetical protein
MSECMKGKDGRVKYHAKRAIAEPIGIFRSISRLRNDKTEVSTLKEALRQATVIPALVFFTVLHNHCV